MSRIQQIAADQRVKESLACFIDKRQDLEDLIVAIQQVPSPTFAEERKAKLLAAKFKDLGLKDVAQDAMHNVFARLPGHFPKSSSPVILSAHIDTVFPLDTDLAVRRDRKQLIGPGIGDNATGVAGLIFLAEMMQSHSVKPKADMWFVCNVGEEGLGDLRGMKAVVQRFGRQAIYIIVEGGSYGQIMHEAIGVSRFRVEINTDGGHSWGSFGRPSAVHEIGHLISELDNLRVPAKPRTTFNVGLVKGGTSVNSIAASSSLLLDLRSEDAEELSRLIKQFEGIVTDRQAKARKAGNNISYRVTQVGERPAGRLSRSDKLVQSSKEALQFVGCSPITFISGSTDANVPLSMGLRSVCIGLTYSGNSHREDEFIEPEFLPFGMQQLMLLALAAASF
jgi:acetylornithine deacetylase/succinyl-diaminopimelate desuccinylase-like protein